jgi:hypothetical protein
MTPYFGSGNKFLSSDFANNEKHTAINTSSNGVAFGK